MKKTFDLPDPLMRRAEALAAQEGRQLRDWVAEAIGEKLGSAAAGPPSTAKIGEGRARAWERWKARLEQLPDGSWRNPDGIEETDFFQSLDEARRESWALRDPFAGHS